MKWFENGIMFEGSVEEFRSLHPQHAPAVPVIAPAELSPECIQIQEASQSIAETKNKSGRKWHPCTAELSGGGCKHFKSIGHAFRWYVEHCPAPNYRTYIMFRKAIEKGVIRFADATICLTKKH